MMNGYVLSNDSASYRLVGVVSIGVTKIPIVSFGYPEYLTMEDEERQLMIECMSSHQNAIVEIECLSEKMDRITWSILPPDMSNVSDTKPIEMPFYVYLDLPMESRNIQIGSRLFSEKAESEKGFLISITVGQETYLMFYSLNKIKRDPKTREICGLIGQLSKFVQGPAVPLLRTIETLKSQLAPQREIEISDDELGIIYSSLAGEKE